LRVDVLSVTKFAVARALLVFIFPTKLRLLKLAVVCDVIRPEATSVLVEIFPKALIDETKRVEGVGAGKTLPLIDETVKAGVDIQLEPVMNVPLTWLEPVTVLKLPDAPKIWLANVSPTTVIVPARAFPMTVEVCDKMVW